MTAIEEIQRITYVGAGMMGCVNSLVAAVSGYDVVLHDRSADMRATVGERHAGIGEFLVASGYCDDEGLIAALGRVSVEADLEQSLAGADLISESIFEDREIKRNAHAEIDRLAPASAIQTTNTSSLMVSDIEDVVGRGDKFAALHSHLGALLYDIVGGPRTAPNTVDVLRRFVESLGGVPMVLRKEHPGYVFNSINGQVMTMAMRLLLDEHASIDEVDRAWIVERGAPMGPFGMMDLFGLDLMYDSWKRPVADPFRTALRERIEPYLADFVERGNLGQKSGVGFYTYPEPAYQVSDFLAVTSESSVASDALLAALVCGAVAVVVKDVADPHEVDTAWSAATNLAEGPFQLLTAREPGEFATMLQHLTAIGVLDPMLADQAIAYTNPA